MLADTATALGIWALIAALFALTAWTLWGDK